MIEVNFNMNFIKKNINYITIGFCILIIISLFLPLVTMSTVIVGKEISESISFIVGDGMIIAIAVFLAIIFLLFKKEAISLILLIGASIISVYDCISAKQTMDNIHNVSTIDAGFGIGFYLLFIGLVISVGCVAYNCFVIKKLKSYQDENVEVDNQQLINSEESQVVIPPQTNSLENANTINCVKCGQVMPNNLNFCTECGTKLIK